MKTRPTCGPFPAALLTILIAAAAPWVVPATARAQMFIISTNAAGTVSSIGEYTPAGVPMKVPLISGIQSIGGIAVSGSNLFVVLNHAVGANDVGTIDEYNLAGTLVKASLVTGIPDPGLVAVSGTNLFALTEVLGTNALIGTIREYSAVTGALENPSLITGLIQPYGMAVSGSDVFVSGGNGAGTIGKYPLSGGVAQPSLISGLPYLGGLAISGSDIFVSEYNNNENLGIIGEYTTAGKTVNAGLVVQSGNTFLPSGIGVSGTDMLVSNEATTGVVAAFTTSGATINANQIAGINPSGIAALPVLLPLPATTLTPPTIGLPGTPLVFTATQSAPNVTVQIQSSTTPTVASSWTGLPDGDGGAIAETSAGVYGTGAGGTTFYPAGTAVSFRAIASETGYSDSISNVVGPFTLDQAALSISYALTSTSDPVAGLVTRIGDVLTYTFTWDNKGDAPASHLQVETPVPTYIDATTDLKSQFPPSDLTYDKTIGIYNAGITGSNNASITWNVANLDPGIQQSVTLQIKIGSQVRIDQQVGLGTNYMVSSLTLQPPTPATGYVLGVVTTPGTNVEGPISFTLTPSSATVAPGGLITYNCVLSNLSSTAATGGFATIVVPDFLRFAASYTVGGSTVSGVSSSTPGLSFGENYYVGSPNPQVVIEVGALAAHGSVSLGITFQAQWADTAVVPTIDYGAGFLDAADYATFKKDFNAGGGTEASPGMVDYTSFLATGTPATDTDVVTANQSGVVKIAVAGSLSAEPLLGLKKYLSNQPTDTLDGLEGSVNLVTPGATMTFLLTANNSGGSEADDVYIEEDLPLDSSFVSGTITSSTPSSTQSALVSTLDALGTDGHHHHVQFSGLKLLADDRIFIQYTALVDGGASAPADGTLIDSDASTIGSSSTPFTPEGLYIGGPIEVIGSVNLAQPIVTPAIPTPVISSGVAATANALTAYYEQAATTADPYPASDIPFSIPGEERYYIQYHNSGSVPAPGVTMKFPIPAHTAFYRASFVAAPAVAGLLPNQLIPPTAAQNVIPPAGANGGFLTTGGTATFTLGSVASGSTGYVMVEVIVGPGAVQSAGSLIGVTDGPVLIQDSAADKNQAAMPVLAVATASPSAPSAPSAPIAAGASRISSTQPAAAAPAVPQLGVLKIAPQAVTAGAEFRITWVIFNYSDQPSPGLDLNVRQPVGTTLVTETYANTYGGAFFISGAAGVPGSLDEFTTNAIPAHSSVAVTYTYGAAGAAGTSIVDDYDYLAENYAGDIYTDPATINVLAKGAPLPQGSNLQYTATGRPIHCFLADSTDVFVIDISATQDKSSVVVYGPATEVSGGTTISDIDPNIPVYGAAADIKVGTTTAAYILANLSNGASLAPFNVKPPTVVVGQGQSYLAPQGALAAAAGSTGLKLITQDGAGIVASGAGNVIGVNGCAFVGHNGSALVASGAGNLTTLNGALIIASGAGNIIGLNGSGIVSTNGSNVLPSTPDSTLTYVTGNNGIVSSGAGNIITEGGAR